MATTVISGIKNAIQEPILTGSLLYILTRGPAHIRERLLQPFQTNLLAKNSIARIAALITALKILTTLGVFRRASQALDALAWNNWSFKRTGAPFKFGPEKEELIIITGGSSGFGYEMVLGFSNIARVVVLDVQAFPPELAKLQDVHFYRCDLSDTAAVEEICKEIKQTHGDATVLVNNAGIGFGKTVLETSNEQSQKLFQVNLISHFVLIREFLPGMLRKQKGHIVTIASMASFVAAPGLLDYCCSKVAALYLTEGIRAECMTRYPSGRGVCTTSVHPSWHATGILKGSESFMEKYGIKPDPPSNVSRLVVEQVLKAKSGRICVPKSDEGKMGLRTWPRWVQDVLFGFVWKRNDGFEFGTQEGGGSKKFDYI